jgi:hypothetical protein
MIMFGTMKPISYFFLLAANLLPSPQPQGFPLQAPAAQAPVASNSMLSDNQDIKNELSVLTERITNLKEELHRERELLNGDIGELKQIMLGAIAFISVIVGVFEWLQQRHAKQNTSDLIEQAKSSIEAAKRAAEGELKGLVKERKAFKAEVIGEVMQLFDKPSKIKSDVAGFVVDILHDGGVIPEDGINAIRAAVRN